MRFIGASPREDLDVEVLGREARGQRHLTDLCGPLLRPADIDVPMGEVRHVVEQGPWLVGGVATVAGETAASRSGNGGRWLTPLNAVGVTAHRPQGGDPSGAPSRPKWTTGRLRVLGRAFRHQNLLT